MSTRDQSRRPQFHFSAARNWINDPNGLVWFEGEYHLFYQYNPFGDQWGHMSWGHAVSADLLHWQELPVAIAEDERVSIFSGSVVVDAHNSSGFGFGVGAAPPLVAIYTGCLRRPEGGQAQELAFSHDRGRIWTKYIGNPVLDPGLRDFRDPKVFWHEPTARWIMLVSLAQEYRLAFYASHDLKAWTLLSHFAAPGEPQGIWECPDIFPLPVEGEAPVWVLKIDVLEGHPSRGSGARLFFGQFDGTRFTAESDGTSIWADSGADFYAALSWANLPATPARQVWIGWMNCHRYAKHTPTAPWRGAMCVPREISLQRVRGVLHLRQQPVRELQALRGAVRDHGPVTVDDAELPLHPAGGDGTVFELELACERSQAVEFGVVLRAGSDEETRVGYDTTRGMVFIDRSRAGYSPPDPHFAGRREAPYAAPAAGAPLRLRILVDRSSVEVFAGEGTVVFTEQIFPNGDSNGLRLYSSGGASHFSRARVWPLAAAR